MTTEKPDAASVSPNWLDYAPVPAISLSREIARLEARIVELEKGRCGVKNLPADWYEHVRWQVMPDGTVKAEPFWMWCDRCKMYHYFPNETKPDA